MQSTSRELIGGCGVAKLVSWGQEAETTLLGGGVGGQINLTSLIVSHSTSVVVIVLSAGLTCALVMVGCCDVSLNFIPTTLFPLHLLM
jgi:hypothetical protein